MSTVGAISTRAVLLVVIGTAGACTATKSGARTTVPDAWRNPSTPPQAEPSTATRTSPPPAEPVSTPRDDTTLAIVDGTPVMREQLVELLIRAHGVGALEQLIVLEAAKRETAARELTVTQADIDAEYDGALRRLLSTLPAGADAPLERALGERLLEQILSSRQVSRAEYLMSVRRNAYLRKIVEHDMRFTDEQVEGEFERAYGERVKVRHVQVASLTEAERIERLLADGADFAELARKYSANPNTAPSGGLLRVFSREDQDVPALMRETAFALEPGAHSNVLRVGEWFHLLEVEEHYPPGEVALHRVRDEVKNRLRRRLTEPAMQQLHQTLLRQAQVQILDPVLAEEFKRKHANSG